jgi:tetratricopeptide (TPR) repeat protein
MKKWIEILLASLIAGCVSSPEQSGSQELGVELVEPAELPISADQVTAIDPKVLYLLMAAELAGQRNQYQLALDGYLQAAKLVNDPRIAERAAKIGLYVKDNARTEEAVKLWLEQDGSNLTARKIAVLSAMKKENKKESVAHLNAVLELDPAGFESTLAEMAQLMEKEGKADFVYEVLEDLSVQHPNQAVVFFMQAVLASKMQKNELAREKNKHVLSLQPDWNKALMLEAQLAGRAGDLDAARKALEQALEQAPDDQRIRKFLAQVLVESREYDDAVELYQQVLEAKENDGESRFSIALIQIQQGNLKEAEQQLEKLVHDSAWVSQASFYMGRIEHERKHWKKALVWFDKVNQAPLMFDAQIAAVSLLLNQKEFSAAEERIVAMEARFPKKQLRIQLLKAEMYNEAGESQQAYDVLTEALAQDADNRDLLYTRALIAERLDRLDLMESDLLKILAENPDDAGALNALGYTLVDRTDRYQEAEVYLQKALELQPDEAVIVDSYGWLLFKLGRVEEARRYIERAYEMQPEPEIAAHLAEILWVLGDKSGAKEVFEGALERAPQDRYLLEFQQRVLSKD